MRRDGLQRVGAPIRANDAGVAEARDEVGMSEASDLVQVVFTPSGKHTTIESGATVLDVGRSLGVDLDSVCGGRGICGHCQIVAAEGEFLEHGLVSTRASLTGEARPCLGATPRLQGANLQ